MHNAANLAVVPVLQANAANIERLLLLGENWQGRPLMPHESTLLRRSLSAIELAISDSEAS